MCFLIGTDTKLLRLVETPLFDDGVAFGLELAFVGVASMLLVGNEEL